MMLVVFGLASFAALFLLVSLFGVLGDKNGRE